MRFNLVTGCRPPQKRCYSPKRQSSSTLTGETGKQLQRLKLVLQRCVQFFLQFHLSSHGFKMRICEAFIGFFLIGIWSNSSALVSPITATSSAARGDNFSLPRFHARFKRGGYEMKCKQSATGKVHLKCRPKNSLNNSLI